MGQMVLDRGRKEETARRGRMEGSQARRDIGDRDQVTAGLRPRPRGELFNDKNFNKRDLMKIHISKVNHQFNNLHTISTYVFLTKKLLKTNGML